MDEQFDVIVVGTRCAGAPLAIQLANAGLQVVAVDKAEFPSDTPSTHLFQVEGILALHRLGVLDRVKATGAPVISHYTGAVESATLEDAWPTRPGDLGGAMCVRRPVLDKILVDAAREAGVDVRTGTIVRRLVEEAGRIAGVEVDAGGGRATLRARLVVGADGRLSTVAKLVGARRYHHTPTARVFLWGYFEGARTETPPRTYFYRRGYDFSLGSPCDNGGFMVGCGIDRERFEADYGRDPEVAFAAAMSALPEMAALIEGATRDGRLRAVARYDGFMRESAGPGWVLVGDAGHFKDPSPGQGISDALRQTERLAPLIVEGLRGDRDLDAALQEWWAWRDDDAFEKHWFASDLGHGGTLLTVEAEILRRLVLTSKGRDAFVNILNHRARPSKVLTPVRLLGATSRLLLRRGSDRRQVLRDAKQLMGTELQRRRLRKHPVYFDAAAEEREVAAAD
jgi:2-polyprenyl-6-methoxyphenol hydroxylase-like FAD-dependent oxidoreductase